MFNLKRGKYADQLEGKKKWTNRQSQARDKWQRARQREEGLCDALRMYPCDAASNREQMHKRLDAVIDSIEKTRNEAKELFPDVGNSFTAASLKVD